MDTQERVARPVHGAGPTGPFSSSNGSTRLDAIEFDGVSFLTYGTDSQLADDLGRGDRPAKPERGN